MVMPVLAVEIAFGDAWNIDTPTWTAVTPYVRHSPPLRIGRSASRITRPRPGSLTVTLDNTDRRFDPDYAAGPYTGDLVPMVPIRVRATHNAVTYDLFRGFVVDWGVSTEDFKDSTMTVTALDGLSVLEMLRVTSPFARLVPRFEPTAWYRFSEPAGATTLADSSGHGYHGTVSGVTFGLTGDIATETDRAGDFDSTDYISLPAASGMVAGQAAATVMVLYNCGGVSPASNYSHFWAQGQVVAGVVDETQGRIDLRLMPGVADVRLLVTPLGSSTTTTLDTGAVAIDSNWHMVAGVIDTTDLELYFDGAIADTDSWAGGSFNPLQIRMGYIGETGTTGSYDGLISEVLVFPFILSATNVSDLYNAATAPWDNQLTSARITAILDDIGWQSADRDLDAGLSTMDALTDTGTALGLLYQAADTEGGALWITKAGKVWFGNRNWRNTATHSAVFSNDGSDTPYQALSWSRDDTELRTVAQVTDSNGSVTEYIGASEATYGPRVISRTTYTTSATEPYDMATWLYGEYGAANTNTELLLEAGAATSTAIWAEILSRELGDLVNVEVKPVGGTTQNDWDMFVEDIRLNVTVDLWQMQLGLVNAGGTGAGQRGFVLDDAVLGKLDGVGRLGF